MRELVVKNALASSSLPDYLSDWVNVFSSFYVYTSAQTNKFSELHLQGGGWYLDCAAGFIRGEEKTLFASLVGSAPDDNIITLEEPDIIELPPPPPKAPKRKTEQRRPPFKHFPKFSLGLLRRPRLSHPSSYTVHLSLPPLLPLFPPLLLHLHFVHNLLTFHFTVALFSSPCLARGRPLSWIPVPPLRMPLTRFSSLKMDMVQVMLNSEVAGGPLPAYTRIQEFIAKVCILAFVNSQFYFLWFASFFPSCFLMKFHLQVGVDRSPVNTSNRTHKGIDLLFADIPENLPVPNISTDVLAWNKLPESYDECLFVFAKSNLYDHGVFVLVHCASASVSRSIFDWAHTYDFYIAEDWFGMNDLDLQSPIVPSGVVNNSPSLPLPYCYSFQFQFNFNFIFIVADLEVQHQGSCSC
jgi:hypothetical protein